MFPQHHNGENPPGEHAIDESFFDVILGFESESKSVRKKTGQAVEEILGERKHADVIMKISETNDLGPFTLLGWMEYCVERNLPVSIPLLERVFWKNKRIYTERKSILKYAHGERLQILESDLEGLLSRMRGFVDLLLQSEDPLVLYHGRTLHIETLLSLEDDPYKVIEYLHDDALGEINFEMQALLADAYERLGRFEEAYEIYAHLQSAHASHIYLEKQLYVLFRLGKVSMAESLYRFGEGIPDYNGKKLRPLSYYRGTIESDNDLETLYTALLPFLGGHDIDTETITLIRSAETYIDSELSVISKNFDEAKNREEDIFAEEFSLLWIRGLFLLEVSTCVLFSARNLPGTKLDTTRQFINTLISLYLKDKENPEDSLLSRYFAIYTHEYMDDIRDIQCEEIFSDEDKTKDPEEDLLPLDIDIQMGGDASYIDTASRLANILDFLYDRLENEREINGQLLDIIIEFHNEIARGSENIDFFDTEGTSYGGEFFSDRLDQLSQKEKRLYRRLSAYIEREYSESMRQMVIFFSLSSVQFGELSLDFIKKDPKVLLFALIVTLLGDESQSRAKISSYLEEPILEALTREEARFLCRLLFQEGYYHEMCKFLIDDGYLIGFPEFIEFFVLSASYLDEIRAETHIETLEQDTLPDRYGYDSLLEYIGDIKSELAEDRASQERLIRSLDHAEMWYNFMIAEEEDVSVEAILTPIPYGKRISPFEASYCLSTFRMLPPATHATGEERLLFLDSLYPYLDLERRDTLQTIFAIALHIKRRDIIEKYLRIAQDEKLYIGHWKYAPLFLGDKKSVLEGFSLIAKDPHIGDIIEPITHYTRQFYNEHIEKQDRTTEIGIVSEFQISYILAYSGQDISERFEEIQHHFSRLYTLMLTFTEGEDLREDSAKQILELFSALGYSYHIEESSPLDYEKYSRELLTQIIGHIVELKRYLQNSLKTGFEDFSQAEASKNTLLSSWDTTIQMIGRILSIYPKTSILTIQIGGFIDSLEKDMGEIFSPSVGENLASSEKNPSSTIIFDNFFSP